MQPPSVSLFKGLIGDRMNPSIVNLTTDASCYEAVQRMRGAGADCVLVQDAERRVVGILTARDVVQRVAFTAHPELPITEVMSRPVFTMSAETPIYRGLAQMHRFRLHHLLVVNEAGQPVGVLTPEAALGGASGQKLDLIERIAREDDVQSLCLAKELQAELADDLLSSVKLPAPDVLAVLSKLNDRTHSRVMENAVRTLSAEGWGDPPVRFAVIVMGSGGRGESLLRPDQDNGFILEDYDDSQLLAVDRYFFELAERMTHELAAIGFPLCKGFVMATNPSWRKRLGEWRTQLLGWLKRPSHAAATLTDLCIDFRCVYGDTTLAAELRSFLTQAIPRYHGFLRELELLQFDRDVAITPFRTLKREKLPGQEGHNQVDIKRKGIMPLVEGIRILSLQQGLDPSSTMDRLRALEHSGALKADLAHEVAEAFSFLNELLLRQHIETHRQGGTPNPYVSPEKLSPWDRGSLRAALRVAAQLRGKVHMDFTAELF
jgi:signal-transduction protein with cAMP-binding, CBS, and nucleotidyltransferase domain